MSYIFKFILFLKNPIMLVQSLSNLVGQAPMLVLHRFPTAFSFTACAKCEQFNPSLSIKDHIVYKMVRSLIERGELKLVILWWKVLLEILALLWP